MHCGGLRCQFFPLPAILPAAELPLCRRSCDLCPCCFVPPDDEMPLRAAGGERLKPPDARAGADWQVVWSCPGEDTTLERIGNCTSEPLKSTISSCRAGTEVTVDQSISGGTACGRLAAAFACDEAASGAGNIVVVRLGGCVAVEPEDSWRTSKSSLLDTGSPNCTRSSARAGTLAGRWACESSRRKPCLF